MPNVFVIDDTTPKKPSMNNKLYTHPHVEDYIEIIAGFRKPDGKSSYSIFEPSEALINLARYDMKIIPSLAEQTMSQGKGYTDRQAKLAAELVLKYERQLLKYGVDVAPVRTPQYRHAIRTLDRSTRVWIENDQIKLRFPYDVKLIETVRDFSKESKGRFYFDRESRLHLGELTEWNLNWIYSFAKQHAFEIDQSVEDLMKLVLAVEAEPYAIELTYTDTQLTMLNAESSLTDYIQEHLGGFELENILTLCDYAPVLGYQVNSTIERDVISNFGTRFWSLCANRGLKVDTMTSKDIVKDIVEYAKMTNRFPIFVYEPDLSGKLHAEFNKFFPNAIVQLDNKNPNQVIDETTRVVYTSKIPKRHFPHIPLMISSAGMLYGGDRQMWIQAAEKVVYFSKDVYNKNTKGTDVCKLA